MELTDLNKSIPIKAIPSESLEKILHTEVKYWLSNLLAMSSEKEESVNNALEAIKFHCWGMGLNEVKKAFEMYANGLLSIDPRSNYLDYILVSKIMNEYKHKKPKKKTMIIEEKLTKEEKENVVYLGVISFYDAWVQDRFVKNPFVWVHDYLMKLGVLNFTDKEKKTMWKQAKENLLNKSKSESYKAFKEVIKQFEQGNNTKREIEYMALRLDAFFTKIESENKHIKDYI